MVKKTDVVEVRFNNPPDTTEAKRLLHEICSKKPAYSPRIVDKPLVLYGAGNLGKMAKEYFQAVGISVLFVVDANPDQYVDDLFWQNVSMFKSEDVPVEYKRNALLAVCIATVPLVPLLKVLGENGWMDIVPFYDITESYLSHHPLGNGWFADIFDENDINNIERVFSRWSDDISRAHHLQFIAWHYLREEWLFDGSPVTGNDRFFIPQVTSLLNKSEVLLDVGAHHGDTTFKFLQKVNNQFKAVFVIEPDEVNLKTLRQNLMSLPSGIIDRIHVLQTAVGDHAGEGIFFSGLGYASQISKIGQHKITVKPIDEIDVEPSFIKLHLEGAELAALKGATKTILSHRPIIVATSYHNDLGLWELPLWIMQLTAGYRFYMRLHSWCGTGSVIYCLPEERCTG